MTTKKTPTKTTKKASVTKACRALIRQEGVKLDGTLKKGYKYQKGGKVVKAKAKPKAPAKKKKTTSKKK